MTCADPNLQRAAVALGYLCWLSPDWQLLLRENGFEAMDYAVGALLSIPRSTSLAPHC